MKKIISILLLLTMILNTTIPTINSIVELNASGISSKNSVNRNNINANNLDYKRI